MYTHTYIYIYNFNSVILKILSGDDTLYLFELLILNIILF